MNHSTKKPPCGGGPKKQYIKNSSPDFTSNCKTLGSFKMGVKSL
jgi:hypothetical protein